jgi:hypothetical protein
MRRKMKTDTNNPTHEESYVLSSTANFYGQKSLGMLQVRGNGNLYLRDQEISFRKWLSKKIIQIPLASITSVETPRSHLGKTKGRTLLKIIFTNEDGKNDSIAWSVDNLSEWTKHIEKIINHNHH